MFFIEDDLLWVWVQTKGELTRVCVVIQQNWIQEILKDELVALFDRHDGVAKTRFNLTKKYWWPSIADFLKNCRPFQKAKLSRNTLPNLLTPSLVLFKNLSTSAFGHDPGARGIWQQQQIHFELYRHILKIHWASGHFWQNTRNSG